MRVTVSQTIPRAHTEPGISSQQPKWRNVVDYTGHSVEIPEGPWLSSMAN